MGIASRRAARIAAVAMVAAGGLLLLGTRPVGATQPPPPTASTAVQVSPTSGLPSTLVSVTGEGFVPAVGYRLMLCPAPACAPGAKAQTCKVPAASNTGTVQCNFEIPQDAPPGDAVVTVYQDIAAGSPAATACPSALASPVATLPALPAALPSPPATPPVPLPNPGDQVTPCVRQASAILTLLPPPEDDAVVPSPPPVDIAPAAPAPVPATVTVPTISAPAPAPAPRPAVTRAPARRAPVRPVAISLPLRSLLPGAVLAAVGLFVFAGSLIPAPAAPAAPAGAAAGAAAGSRLRRFVQTVRR